MPDNLKLITEKFDELQPLHDRMDRDKTILYRTPYVMRNNAGKPIKNVHNVTLPIPSIFFWRAVSILSTATQQVDIENEKESMSDKETTLIERYLTDMAYEIDTTLTAKGMQERTLTQWERACARGWLGDRCCIREEDKKIVTDILPLDMRWVAYEYGSKELEWVAPTFKKNRKTILNEYGIDIEKKTAVVSDFWDKKINEVYIDGVKLFDQENPYGYVPYVINMAPTGSNLSDDDTIEHRGESILQFIREMCGEANRFVSILATLTEYSFNNNLQYASKQGEGKTQPPEGVELDVAKTFPIDIGGGYTGMPIADTHRAAQMLWGIVNEVIQMGSMGNINYGTIQFPMSGIAISQMMETRDKIIIPELQLYSLQQRGLSQMMIKQMIDQKISSELGEPGHRKKYTYTELKGDYSIKYRFFSESKEQQIADSTIADAVGPHVSEDYIRRHIFKLQNPDDEKRNKNLETLRKTNPLVDKYYLVHELIDEKEWAVADMIANEVYVMIQSGQVMMSLPEGGGKPKDMIPLLESGGTSTRPPMAGAQ